MDSTKTILVVDDEETIRKIVKFHLKRTTKYEVLDAADGKEAINLAKSEKPDLILLDLLMPGMSGNDVMEHLMNDPATSSIPVIFLTGAVTKDDIKSQGGVVGGRRFIAKPVEFEELISVVDSVFQK